jgi:hypothetical protein
VVDTINACFSTLLPDAYANGASVLKFSGDALLLWFKGEAHAVRAAGRSRRPVTASGVAEDASGRRAGEPERTHQPLFLLGGEVGGQQLGLSALEGVSDLAHAGLVG